jgi:putative membrane protein
MININKQNYVTKAASHYRRLFSLPSHFTLLLITAIVNLFGSWIAFQLTLSLRPLVFGGLVLTLSTLAADAILSTFVIAKDLVFTRRRISGISFFVCLIWVIILVVGSLIQLTFNTENILIYASFFSASTGFAFRTLIFAVISTLKKWESVLAIGLQPSFYLLSLFFFWSINFTTNNLVFATLTSTIILCSSTLIFIKLINAKGNQAIGIGAITLFKHFLLNWIANINSSLETHFEKIGIETQTLISLLAFKKNDFIESILVVPMIHPGPFKNVGSSNLPYQIQTALKTRFNNIVAVPHGTCSHESNLTSQKQCDKVVNEVIKLSQHLHKYSSLASKLIRVKKNSAHATCQIFGDVALITLTFAPLGMEDVPKHIGLEIREIGKKLGFKDVIVIDAHNSISESNELQSLTTDKLRSLVEVADQALNLAVKEKRFCFKMGIAHITPLEFGNRSGIGSSGIVTIIITVSDQRVAYVIIDGNNMISGLRERVLSSLNDLIDIGEILTTDTHSVSALQTIDRGYHPVGEALDVEILIKYIKQAVNHALQCVGATQVSFLSIEMKVKILSSKGLLDLSKLVEEIYNYVVKLSPILYIPSFSIAILLFITILFKI